MIQKYRFGCPFETVAVTETVPCTGTYDRHEQESAAGGLDGIPYFSMSEDGREVSCPLEDGDAVYGLGENVRGINKRGWKYVSSCIDGSRHLERWTDTGGSECSWTRPRR